MSIPPPSKRGARGGIGPRDRNRPIFRRFLPKLRCVAAADLHGGSRQDGPGSPRGLSCPTTMAERRHASKEPGSTTAHSPASSWCFLRVFAPWPWNLASHLVINLAEYSAPALSPPRQRERKRPRKLPIFTSFSRRTRPPPSFDAPAICAHSRNLLSSARERRPIRPQSVTSSRTLLMNPRTGPAVFAENSKKTRPFTKTSHRHK